MSSGSEAGSYVRLIDCCIAQLNESKKKRERRAPATVIGRTALDPPAIHSQREVHSEREREREREIERKREING